MPQFMVSLLPRVVFIYRAKNHAIFHLKQSSSRSFVIGLAHRESIARFHTTAGFANHYWEKTLCLLRMHWFQWTRPLRLTCLLYLKQSGHWPEWPTTLQTL